MAFAVRVHEGKEMKQRGDNSARYIRHRSWQVCISSTHEQALKAPFCDAHSAKLLLEQNKLQNYKNEERRYPPQSQILNFRDIEIVKSYLAMFGAFI